MTFPNCLKSRSPYKLSRPTIYHPNIVQIFRAHCESGNSPRSFIPQIFGGAKAYSFLFHNNREFREINDRFKSKTRPKIYSQNNL